MGDEETSPALHSPALSRRTVQNIDDLQVELAATQAELDRALDTINNLSSTIEFLRKHR